MEIVGGKNGVHFYEFGGATNEFTHLVRIS